MLKATEEESEEVREYFEWQAPDLDVIFMQKVYSEVVLNTRHDVWDIHTNKDRWWVITGGTNLYSQQQFPNMDLALTFHIGLILRIPRTEKQQDSDLRILPFGPVFDKMEEADRGALRSAGFSDRDIWDISATAAFYNMSNRMAAATDMRPNPQYHAMAREKVEKMR